MKLEMIDGVIDEVFEEVMNDVNFDTFPRSGFEAQKSVHAVLLPQR